MPKSTNMAYKRLFWNVLIRVVLITINATVLGFLFVFLSKEDLFTLIFVGGLLILQMVLFISSYNRSNRDLSSFLASVQALDASISFRDSQAKKNFAGLYENMMRVNSLIGGLKIKLEEQNQYYKSIINQAPNAIISYYNDGKIDLINAAAMALFRVGSIRNMRELATVSSELVRFLLDPQSPGQQVIKTGIGDEKVSLMVKRTTLILRKQKIRIASIQNIESELVSKESESWQKLLKVMTHEIANSIGPISSTIDTLKEGLANNLSEIPIRKLQTGLEIIGERSEGLMQLIDDIRRFSSFPPPKFNRVQVSSLVASSLHLLQDELSREGVKVRVAGDQEDLSLEVDEQLIIHVLINLITNAKEAMHEQTEKKLDLIISSDCSPSTTIRIIDNGPGISPERLDQIFIPFYTSKQSGSGIGLSLSREIMRQHGGSLTVVSKKGRTEFVLKF